MLSRPEIHAEWLRMQQRYSPGLLAMLKSNQITIGNKTMKFQYFRKGSRPDNGYTLVIGLHGGGGCTTEVNDQQYSNHLHLYDRYMPPGTIWFVPRSCEQAPDMWWKSYIEQFLTAVIHAFVVTGMADANKVFVTGYSAGGDGVYHLGPMMADWLAGAAMMAGHPNNSQMQNIRNMPFSIQCGADDGAYNRNKLAQEYIEKLKRLSNEHGGFKSYNYIFDGEGHWMHHKDAHILISFLQQKRQPYPDYILWKQHPRTSKKCFYYLEVDPTKHDKNLITCRKVNNTFYIEGPQDVIVTVYFNELMVDFNQQVRVHHNNTVTARKRPQANMDIVRKTVDQRGDPDYVFQDRLVSVPGTVCPTQPSSARHLVVREGEEGERQVGGTGGESSVVKKGVGKKWQSRKERQGWCCFCCFR